MYDFILFDLDGTLTDSADGIVNSALHALGKRGIAVSDRSELYKFIGPPLMDSFMQFFGFTHEESVQAVVDYREYYANRGIWENTLYPGIPELLADLKAAGKTVIMATSKPEHFARQIADRLDIAKHFDLIAGSTMDETRTKKSDVITYALAQLNADGARAVMIGDRFYDVVGANALNIPCIGVTFGYGSEEELRTAGAAALAHNTADLHRLLLG
ncbi:MAG: HAD family hydrolase [Clostridia bacterium]|nr:HAD family hydrolase [Clostridia bacterium]